jgi:hypothetical protein
VLAQALDRAIGNAEVLVLLQEDFWWHRRNRFLICNALQAWH